MRVECPSFFEITKKALLSHSGRFVITISPVVFRVTFPALYMLNEYEVVGSKLAIRKVIDLRPASLLVCITDAGIPSFTTGGIEGPLLFSLSFIWYRAVMNS